MVNFWGLSPSINLLDFVDCCYCQDEIGEHSSNGDKGDSLTSAYHVHNFLLIGSSDGRHAIELLSNQSKQKGCAINIYMVENLHELLARELVFLSLGVDDLKNQSILQRSENFLEIFGNTHMRPQTQDVLNAIGQRLVSVLTQSAVFPLVSTSYLKKKDAEEIAGVIRNWINERDPIDIKTMWEIRVRSHYGQRYDNRRALYDWDYNMKFQAPIKFSLDQYVTWRETGMAFKFVEGRYTCPNKTICTIEYESPSDSDALFVRTRGRALMSYKGDILYSPYIAYSAATENGDDPSMSQDQKNGMSDAKNKVINLMRLLSLDDCSSAMNRVYPMTANGLRRYAESSFYGYFDCIFYAHDSTHLIGRFLPDILRDKGCVVVETTKFLFDADKGSREKHFLSVVSELDKVRLRLKTKCDPLRQHFAVFCHRDKFYR